MSFSYDVKEELVRQVGAARHCQIAELAALISGCGEIGIQTNGNLVLIIRSENMLVVEKACILVKKAFRITAEVSVFGNGDIEALHARAFEGFARNCVGRSSTTAATSSARRAASSNDLFL